MRVVEVIQEQRQMPALLADWDRLSRNSAYPMLSYDWAWAAASALQPGDRLCLAVLRDSGSSRVSAIAPLVALKRSAPPCLSSLLNHCVPEPAGFLFEDQQALNELLKGVMRHGYPLRIKRVPSEAAMLVGRTAAPIILVRPELASPRLRVEGSWEEFERTISGQRRADIRRARRKAEALGQIGVAISSPSPAAAQDFLVQFHRIESQSWKFKAGSSVQQDPVLHRFIDELCSTFAAKARLRTALLEVSGKPAAAQLALCYGSAIWALKIAHDERFSACSPGLLITHELVRSAFNEGLEAFEFLGVEEPWIHTWTHDRREYRRLLVYGCSLRSASALAFQLGRSVRSRFGGSTENAHV